MTLQTEPTTVLLDAVATLKADIQRDVAAAVARFYERTALSPNRIVISMLEATAQTDIVRRYIVGQVSVSMGEL